MKDMIMSYKEIRDSIILKEREWNNISFTNCYAYALGLDITSTLISKFDYPYIVGSFGQNLVYYKDFYNMSLEERLFLDLKALDIDVEKVEDTVSDDKSWFIAMYEDKCDKNNQKQFHFIRMSKNGIWFHKKGLYGCISCFDTAGNMITDPKKAVFYSYNVINGKKVNCSLDGIYKLSLKK